MVADLRAAMGRAAFDRVWQGATAASVEDILSGARYALEVISRQAEEPLSSRAVDRRAKTKLLTRREREVAVLLARGYTNREVARTMVISTSTAERHVANILRKLGMRSRIEVALAAQQGIFELDQAE
jgi:DNA-binding NarL/FixJ family response regulator